MGAPAVFLDRDGTLIEERGDIGDPTQAVWLPGAVEAARRLAERFVLFIVTNQGGVARGTITADGADRVNRHVARLLGEAGAPVREIYCCPHANNSDCECRKPRPGSMRRAAADHDADLARSFVVGDHPCDVEMAHAVGARGLYVLTGHGEKHRGQLSVPCDIVSGIAEAADRILAVEAARTLRGGGVVAFPTETVYGLGADAENRAAVERVFALKGRPERHPVIVHLASADALPLWGRELPEAAHKLAKRFWPGPLTLIVKRQPRVPDAVTGGQDTVGLRVPSHPLALAMLREFGGGVAAPSANRFGRVSPTAARHVRDDFGGALDFVLDGGSCSVGVESTIVDLAHGEPRILRPGGVPREAIEAELGRAVAVVAQASDVRAPGALASHYAPRAEVVLVEPGAVEARAAELRAAGRRVVVLAPGGATEDAARALYSEMRRADAEGADAIVVALPPEAGLGLAIADRLRKAAARKQGRSDL